MKTKYLLLYTLLFSILFLTSCWSSWDLNKSDNSSINNDIESSWNVAWNTLINYMNEFINVYNMFLPNLETFYSNLNTWLNNVSLWSDPFSPDCSSLEFSEYDDYKSVLLKFNTGLKNKEENEKLKENVKNYLDWIDSLIWSCKKLEIYVNSKNYKDDNFEWYNEMTSKIKGNLDNLFLISKETVEMLDDLSVKYSPLKNSSDPYEKLLFSIESLLNTWKKLLWELNNEVLDNAKIKSLNDKLTLSINESKDLEQKVIDEYNKVYTKIYVDRLETYFEPSLKSLIREIEIADVNELNKSIEKVFTEYNNIVEIYNNMVNG